MAIASAAGLSLRNLLNAFVDGSSQFAFGHGAIRQTDLRRFFAADRASRQNQLRRPLLAHQRRQRRARDRADSIPA